MTLGLRGGHNARRNGETTPQGWEELTIFAVGVLTCSSALAVGRSRLVNETGWVEMILSRAQPSWAGEGAEDGQQVEGVILTGLHPVCRLNVILDLDLTHSTLERVPGVFD